MSKQSNVRLEPTFKHGPISGPVNAVLGALALTAMIWGFNQAGAGWPTWLPVAFAAAGSAMASAVTIMLGSPIPNLIFRVGCWVAGGVWSTLTLTVIHGFNQVALMLLVLVFCGGLAGVAVPALGVPVDANQPANPELAPMQAAAPDDGDLVARALTFFTTRLLQLREGESITYKRVKNWPNDSGATFLADFSLGSSKGLSNIVGIEVPLAQALRLEDGCTVKARRSGVQGQALVEVMFYDGLAEVVPYPVEDIKPSSAMNPSPVGRKADRTCFYVCLYQESGAIIGQRGGGKTVLMHDITAGIAQCLDMIIWHVDLNNGSVSIPWCYLTAKGELKRHVIDWVAHDPETMLEMAKAAEAIAVFRKAFYASMLQSEENDDDKLPISRKVPGILVMIDEGGETFGSDGDKIVKEASARFRRMQRLGRAMCVNLVFSVQRGTAEYLPAQMKKNASLKFALPVEDDSEIAYLMDWNKVKIKSDELMYDGMAVVRSKATGREVVKIRTFYLGKPSMIHAICRKVVDWRPELDAPSANHVAHLYNGRWDKPSTKAWLNSIAGGTGGEEVAYASHATTALLTRPAGGDGGMDGFDDALADLRGDLTPRPTGGGASTPPPASRPRPTGGGDDGKRHLDPVQAKVNDMRPEDMLASLAQLEELEVFDPRATTTPPAPGQPEEGSGEDADTETGMEWCYRYVVEHGPVKTQTVVKAAVEAGLITNRRQTVSDWMGKLATAAPPRIVRAKNADGSDWYAHWVADIHAA